MPRWSLKKKLNPANKAWKHFTTKLKPKLENLLKHSITTALKSAIISLSSFLRSKFRSIANPNPKNRRNYINSYHKNPSSYTLSSHQNSYHNHNMVSKNFTAIHVDTLFDQPSIAISSNMGQNTLQTSVRGLGHSVPGTSKNRGDSDELYSVEDAWRKVVASSPQLRCVDERAEEFIFKVRQDMRIQKEKSNLEFQEMLARGA